MLMTWAIDALISFNASFIFQENSRLDVSFILIKFRYLDITMFIWELIIMGNYLVIRSVLQMEGKGEFKVKGIDGKGHVCKGE